MSALVRVGIVFNGSKNRRALSSFLAQAEPEGRARGGAVAVYEAGHGGEVEALARQAVADGNQVVMAAGGDGTVLGVLRGIQGSDAVLGLIPLGTSNDFARLIGLPDLNSALSALRAGKVRQVDLGRADYVGVDGRDRSDVFCLSGGLWFTAAIAQAETRPLLNRLKQWFGNDAFLPACAWLAVAGPEGPTRIEIDGQQQEVMATLLEVSKSPSIGQAPLTPRARPDNGYLDLAVFHGGPLRKLALLARIQTGGGAHASWADFDYYCDDASLNRLGLSRPCEVVVEPRQRAPMHLHGEFLGWGPARFTVAPGQLRVLVAS
jgi:diacylglycerol kinase family enzyme